MSKTAPEIISEVNAVARLILLRAVGTGYVVPDSFRLDKSESSRAQIAWATAVEVYELLTGAEVHDALLEEAEAGPLPAETRDLSHGLVYPRSPTTGNGDEP